MEHDPIKCICCGNEITEEEWFLYDDVCQNCMDDWAKENQALKNEYYRSLL